MAALLSRRHLILSGPTGIGKCRLAQALAGAMTDNRQDRLRVLQGHPWWAADTDDVVRFVNAQTEYTLWRLADFLEDIARNRSPEQAARTAGTYVICIKRMGPAELEFYFGELAHALRTHNRDASATVALRLIGTYDSETAPDLSDRALRERIVGIVHLGGTAQEDRMPVVRVERHELPSLV